MISDESVNEAWCYYVEKSLGVTSLNWTTLFQQRSRSNRSGLSREHFCYRHRTRQSILFLMADDSNSFSQYEKYTPSCLCSSANKSRPNHNLFTSASTSIVRVPSMFAKQCLLCAECLVSYRWTAFPHLENVARFVGQIIEPLLLSYQTAGRYVAERGSELFVKQKENVQFERIVGE